jgi:hypothetical protein
MLQITCQTGTTEHAELENDTFQLRHYAFHTRRQVQFSYIFLEPSKAKWDTKYLYHAYKMG